MRKPVTILLGAMAALWLGNTSLWTAPSDTPPRLIAHRGVHQLSLAERTNDSCRAQHVAPITHDFVENTLPSIREATRLGADMVEVDVHLTPDGTFALFHDWRLECQTNGTGVTEQQDFATLQALDLGYNITADGLTFPFRGKGLIMPSLTGALAAPSAPLLINYKSRRPEEGTAIAPLHAAFPGRIAAIYGGAPPSEAAHAATGLPYYTKDSTKSCLMRYALLGWTGHVPDACQTGLVAVPLNVGPWLWGWPHRLTARMHAAGSEVILLGDYDGSGFSSGIDDEGLLARVPKGWSGYLWTNRIEWLGPRVKTR
ncbi:glycerophosphodiester phosphodiesterase family protein [Tropicibacter naphthalenivorans]|uniref:Glycerophosphoryl diester phosphodiesterase n=1 Tax=Tropicibacter naphthalenivorans TaxID=441103 RepID=A0A0P1FZS7_9RHOB|nr:glycerophosphodiester phosphodiesterase family protein [Tropicibacter naphthalenivorans]CUH74823.1 Glycerophosphoryl diester phosphodiesterase [Tropicibacter naphthalenivorans]SMC48745.1 glycerophosphoryl diester phosphodiesterase [Tropicibacter naphthalenivorans]